MYEGNQYKFTNKNNKLIFISWNEIRVDHYQVIITHTETKFPHKDYFGIGTDNQLDKAYSKAFTNYNKRVKSHLRIRKCDIKFRPKSKID